MNTGTQAAKEAGNMVDLDSNPTKLIEVVETGKQMLMSDFGRRDPPLRVSARNKSAMVRPPMAVAPTCRKLRRE